MVRIYAQRWPGRDMVSYSQRTAAVTADLDGARGDGTLSGSAGDDTLHGQNGTDALSGGRGDDVLRAEPGTRLAEGETPGSDDVKDGVKGGANTTATPGDSCFVRAGGTTTGCETILLD